LFLVLKISASYEIKIVQVVVLMVNKAVLMPGCAVLSYFILFSIWTFL